VTCVMDRGIFSHEVFTQTLAAPDQHLITWKNNFKPGQWNPQNCVGQYVLEQKTAQLKSQLSTDAREAHLRAVDPA
jgi:hypothetical protein